MTVLAAYSFNESSGDVLDYSGNNHFSLTGTNGIRVDTGHTSKGLTKNGVTNPQLPLIGQTANRTVMLWAKGVGEVWYVRWHVVSIDSGSWGILCLSGQIGVQARNASTFVRPSVAVPADGQWHHYAGTYDGTTVRFYLDGVEVASNALAGPLRVDANVVDVAHWTDGNTIIDDLRIIDETYNQSQIQAAMNSPVIAIGANMASIADEARTNMLADRSLTEPQLKSNIDLMSLVLLDGAQTLVPKTEASTAEHYEKYLITLRNS